MGLKIDTLSVAELKERLAHVVWIGGGTDAGKTSTSRYLATKYNLEIYHYDRESPSWNGKPTVEEAFPNSFRWSQMTDAERWLRPAVLQEQLLYGMWAEKWVYRLQDLLDLPTDRGVVAEGYGFLPSYITPLLTDRQKAIWLVPSPAFKQKTFAARVQGGHKGGYRHRLEEGARALALHQERDMLITERIRREAAVYDVRLHTVDGSQPLEATFELVQAHFSSFL